MVAKSIPKDQVNLKLIYVNGGEKAKEFLVSPTSTALDIAKHVYENWPEEWNSNKVDRAEILRLIYQGKFLHENVNLSSLNIKAGKTTVMHLIPRERLPEPNIDDNRKDKSAISAETGCCGTCTVL